jgi:hypothetical protein
VIFYEAILYSVHWHCPLSCPTFPRVNLHCTAMRLSQSLGSLSMSQASHISRASVSSWVSGGCSACSRAEVSGISAHTASYPGKGAKYGAGLYCAPLVVDGLNAHDVQGGLLGEADGSVQSGIWCSRAPDGRCDVGQTWANQLFFRAPIRFERTWQRESNGGY